MPSTPLGTEEKYGEKDNITILHELSVLLNSHCLPLSSDLFNNFTKIPTTKYLIG